MSMDYKKNVYAPVRDHTRKMSVLYYVFSEIVIIEQLFLHSITHKIFSVHI